MNSSHCWIENSHTFIILADLLYYLSMFQIQFFLLTQYRNSIGSGCVHATTQLPVLYLILRAGAGVDAGGGRAYGVRDF